MGVVQRNEQGKRFFTRVKILQEIDGVPLGLGVICLEGLVVPARGGLLFIAKMPFPEVGGLVSCGL